MEGRDMIEWEKSPYTEADYKKWGSEAHYCYKKLVCLDPYKISCLHCKELVTAEDVGHVSESSFICKVCTEKRETSKARNKQLVESQRRSRARVGSSYTEKSKKEYQKIKDDPEKLERLRKRNRENKRRFSLDPSKLAKMRQQVRDFKKNTKEKKLLVDSFLMDVP
jgi:hypothetical protein